MTDITIDTNWQQVAAPASGTGSISTIRPRAVFISASVGAPTDTGHELVKGDAFNFNMAGTQGLWVRCLGRGLVSVTVDA